MDKNLCNIVGEYTEQLMQVRPYDQAANVELIVGLYNFLEKQFKSYNYNITEVHFYNMQEWEELCTIYPESIEGYYETENKKIIFGQECGEWYIVDKFNK